jgi:hypothetical protein
MDRTPAGDRRQVLKKEAHELARNAKAEMKARSGAFRKRLI